MITLSESAENAKSEVKNWLNELTHREFIEHGVVDETERVVLVNDILKELEEQKAEALRKLPIIKNEIRKYKENGDKRMEGRYHIQYGNILTEELCSDMPFFNKWTRDWTIPTEVKKYKSNSEGFEWYAVMVCLDLL
jgi:tRNA/tmRNA/rRNA uracil-C5-methylase (TrmA/RlmC/RlmD family)